MIPWQLNVTFIAAFVVLIWLVYLKADNAFQMARAAMRKAISAEEDIERLRDDLNAMKSGPNPYRDDAGVKP